MKSSIVLTLSFLLIMFTSCTGDQLYEETSEEPSVMKTKTLQSQSKTTYDGEEKKQTPTTSKVKGSLDSSGLNPVFSE